MMTTNDQRQAGSRSCGSFVRSGILQAGLVFIAVFLIAAAIRLAAPRGSRDPFALGVFVSATAALSGPIPWLLICVDISNRTLNILWVALLLPYWCCLGTAAGLIRHRLARRTTTNADRVSASLPRFLKQPGWIVAAMAGIIAIGLFLMLGPIGGPGFISSGPSITSRIMNNLRQVDGAKQALAIDKKLSPDYVPTEAELAPYFGGVSFQPVGPERYVVNSIRERPYAVLDSDWRIPRRGWREGRTISKQEFRLQ